MHQKGAHVYEEPYKYLHMKAIEIDDGKMMQIGSFNQDLWSYLANNEANIMLMKNETSAITQEKNRFKAHDQFIKSFNQLQKECRPVDFTEKYRGWLLI